MSISKRKIGFYAIQVKKTGGEIVSPQLIPSLLDFISNKSNVEKIKDIPQQKRVFSLQSFGKFEQSSNIYHSIFISAKYSHRPDLLNKHTGETKDNPKTMDEGEKEPTHLCLKIQDNEILVLLEQRQVGITMSRLLWYLRQFIKEYCASINDSEKYILEYSIIPKEDLLEELNRLRRIPLVYLYVDKELISSDFARNAGYKEEVREEIQLILKADKKKDLKNTVTSLIHDFINRANSRIRRIRIMGTDDDKNPVSLDTDSLKMVQYINGNINEGTGIVEGQDLLNKMYSMLS